MGWQDFYRRRDALDAAVELGKLTRSEPFPTEEALLQALHHRWTQRLTAQLELAELSTNDPLEAAAKAWQTTKTENQALRALLDEHKDKPALAHQREAEHRTLAQAAGLTEPTDTKEEKASIGAAFEALQRSAPTRRPNPVERLLRRLAPSA